VEVAASGRAGARASGRAAGRASGCVAGRGGGRAGVAGGAGSSASFRRRRKSPMSPGTFRRLYDYRPGPSAPLSTPAFWATVSTPVERLRSLGVLLPVPPRPAGTYAPVVRSGRWAWVSGQIVIDGGAAVHPGLVDRDVPLDVAQGVARQAMLQALSALEAELGSIDRIRRAVRVGVFVASSPGFQRQHDVANGATQLLTELFSEAGRPTRAAVGVAGLPLNAPVEVELLVEVD